VQREGGRRERERELPGRETSREGKAIRERCRAAASRWRAEAAGDAQSVRVQ
jgi:hypothetical protein